MKKLDVDVYFLSKLTRSRHPSRISLTTRFRRSFLSSRFATRLSISYADLPVTKIRSYVFGSNNEASDEDRKIYVSFLRVEFLKIAFDAAESGPTSGRSHYDSLGKRRNVFF